MTKTQEHKTLELINCVMKLKQNIPSELKLIKEKVRNCEIKNLDNILSEIYKRLVIPLYLPTLMLLALLLIVNSKEKVNYSKLRLSVFLLGFFTIVFSESTLRFVGSSSNKNLMIAVSPFITLSFLYFYFILKFNLKIFMKIYIKFLISNFIKSFLYVFYYIKFIFIINLLTELEFFKNRCKYFFHNILINIKFPFYDI